VNERRRVLRYCWILLLTLCHVASSRRQRWEQSRFQEQMWRQVAGRGLWNQPALSRVPWQSSPLPHGWNLAWHRLSELRAARGAWVHIPLLTPASSCWPCKDLAPGPPPQSLDPFFPLMPYAVSPLGYRSTDARARSVLPSGAFRELSTKLNPTLFDSVKQTKNQKLQL